MKQMRLLMLALIMTTPLLADVYVVVKYTIAGNESISTNYTHNYTQGRNIRSESGGSIHIFKADAQTTLILDPSRKQYMELKPRPAVLLTLARWIVRPRDSGKTVHIYYETRDTGERKDFFGRTARHVITRERIAAEPGACTLSQDAETDGWYIALPGERRTRAEVRALGDRPCHDQVIRHGEPAWPGFAMLSVRGQIKQEVLEFSTAPLDRKLFEAPADYKRTDPPTNSWIQDLNWQWPMLQRAIETWFE